VARVRGPDEQETYIIAFGVIPSSRAGRFRDARAGFGLTLIAGIRNSRISDQSNGNSLPASDWISTAWELHRYKW